MSERVSLCQLIETHHKKDVLSLIEDGVSVYKTSRKSPNTPLYFALMAEEEEVAQAILTCYERDMKIVWTGRKDYIPVKVAYGRYQIARVRDLAEDTLKNQSDKFGLTLEKVLLYHPKYPEVVTVNFKENDELFRKELLNNGFLDVTHKSHRDQNYLHLACVRGYKAIFKRLLRLGVSYTDLDKNGDSCLYLATISGHFDIASMLLKLPEVDIKSRGKQNMSLIAAAAMSGNVRLFDEVLNKSIQYEMSSSHKELWDYASAAKITKDLLSQDQHLIHIGSPLEMVIHLIELYIPDQFLDIAFAIVLQHNSYPMVRKLISTGADVFKSLPPNNRNALYIVADNGCYESFEIIIRHYPPDAFRLNLHGCVEALHRAIYCKHDKIAVKLLDLGVDPNAKDDSLGYTFNAVHLCAYWNNVNMIKTLINRGANLNEVDSNSKQTALGIALNKGHKDIVKQLKSSVERSIH